MHFEILVEDASGKIALQCILQKMLGKYSEHTFRIFAYKGIGRIPKRLETGSDPAKRILLDQLPRLLRGYGRSMNDVPSAVIVVLDLDDKDCILFKRELVGILDTCQPRPKTLFRIAIEEMEAWLLGSPEAVKSAYPKAKALVLDKYVQDNICGTWELLADAVHPGGSITLTKLGWPHIGQAKCEWARTIAPRMDIDTNSSKSFQVFRDGIRRLAGIPGKFT